MRKVEKVKTTPQFSSFPVQFYYVYGWADRRLLLVCLWISVTVCLLLPAEIYGYHQWIVLRAHNQYRLLKKMALCIPGALFDGSPKEWKWKSYLRKGELWYSYVCRDTSGWLGRVLHVCKGAVPSNFTSSVFSSAALLDMNGNCYELLPSPKDSKFDLHVKYLKSSTSLRLYFGKISSAQVYVWLIAHER